MKPININKKDGSKTTSASNTIWDGPDIPCLDLCKGDTIDKVLYDLALKVCKKFEELDPENYNLECLDIEGCETISFQQLIQILIDRSCEQEEDTPPPSNGSGNCCDDIVVPITVRYAQAALNHNLESNDEIISFTSHTVAAEGGGIFELDFTVDVELPPADRIVSFCVAINGVQYQPTATARNVGRTTNEGTEEILYTNTRLFVSNIPANAGDVISVMASYDPFAPNSSDFVKIDRGVIKITKIS